MDSGVAVGPYNAYYDSVSPSNVLTLYYGGGNATGLTYSQVTTFPGVGVSVPDGASNVIIVNTSNSNQQVLMLATQTPTQTPTYTPTPTNTSTPTQTSTTTLTATQTQTPTPTTPAIQFGTYTANSPGSAPTPYTESSTACRQSNTLTGQQLYQSPSAGISPGIGYQLYTNVSLTTAWNPSIAGNRWFKMSRGGTYWAVEVSISGIIQSFIDCSTIPTQTPTPTVTPTTSIIRTPNYANQGYQTCYSTTLYTVYLDINPNSYTYNHYFAGAGTIDLGTSPPAAGNNTDVWSDNGNYRCNSSTYPCVEEKQQTQTNPCGVSGNGATRWVANPGGTQCNTTQNWVNEGSTFCSSCVVYQTQRQTNPCAADYNTTRNVNLGAGAPCNYNASYSDVVGTLWYCPSNQPNSAEVFVNTNPCFTGNQWYSNGNTYSSNPSNTENDVAEVYSLRRCSDLAILYSIVYCKGTFTPNTRVELSDGTICYIITTLTVNYADVYSITAIGGTGCPEVYTQFVDCYSNYWYINGTTYNNGQSNEVPDLCLFNQGQTDTPLGTIVYNFAAADCNCP